MEDKELDLNENKSHKEVVRIKTIIIYYHYPCLDGAYSCYLLCLFLGFSKSNFYYFYPTKSNEEILFDNDILAKSKNHQIEIYILDKGLLLEDISNINELLLSKILNKDNLKFFIFDHHYSSINNIKEKLVNIPSNLYLNLSSDKSASLLVLEYIETYSDLFTIVKLFCDNINMSMTENKFNNFEINNKRDDNEIKSEIENIKKITLNISDEDTGILDLNTSIQFKCGISR